jgi:Ca2+-binding RTX toxin-like protein
MGISNDYGIAPAPNTSDPDPQTGNDGFLAYKQAGIDSFQFHIRGGTHEESAFIPGMTVPVLGLATLRGGDLVAWYTTAWFDKEVKCADGSRCEAKADRRLLTDRWRDDARSGQVDANGDPNVFSFYRRSRFDFATARGREVTCDDMRAGCVSMRPDGLPGGYNFVSDAYTPLHGSAGGDACALAQKGTAARDTPATLPPSAAGDVIRGGDGGDRLRGGRGDDCLIGQGGRDRLRGDGGRDKVSGGAGGDRLAGNGGRDVLNGGPGRDVLLAKGGGRDAIRCGAGRDRVVADRRDRLGKGC